MSSPKKQSSKRDDPISCIIEPSKVLGGLYLGNMEAASDPYTLSQYQIKAILTVCPQSIPSSTKIKLNFYHQCMADDEDDYQISKHFDESFRFIEASRRSTNVLVHCQMGISRSAVIVLAYLIKKDLIGAREALEYVEQRRSIIFPNNGFLRQLGTFERQVFNDVINEANCNRRIASPKQVERDYKQKQFDDDFEMKLQRLKESNKQQHFHYEQQYTIPKSNVYRKQENTLFSNLYYKHY
ncbi:unnamed protein product (macronuclear) [Paramecium tetraurelia]|uniref:protein-tyrosine-phosphatase n=1 Tax=Paramecium tetraurelia TaxID=5888 RepID=A0BJH0_PARTE|nr:uncharacterized protein GSPATT00029314001 [Paramecium tetraurelia]CAK58687.1 unnamed protein product [Paramecium tetraurelia]|eukprot:XP_001426085.1 hypothetical protein (macronuclear) [Paramecium tetraurelia strain d4-2]